jgi:hypothetical protein
MLIRYLGSLTTGRIILWCYVIWYAVVLVRYFEASPRLWLTSAGLSLIIGIALVISTTTSSRGAMKLDRWQLFRLFLMPFCVSSFAALVKDKGFVLIFSPNPMELLAGAGLCALFVVIVQVAKRLLKRSRAGAPLSWPSEPV